MGKACRAPKVAYIPKGFPRTSETFISNEIHLPETLGLKLSIYSMKQLQGQQRHGVLEAIRAEVTNLPEASDLTG